MDYSDNLGLLANLIVFLPASIGSIIPREEIPPKAPVCGEIVEAMTPGEIYVRQFFFCTLNLLYTGWWYTYPSEKYEFVSWDYDIPNWMESHKIHVPNHQPVYGDIWLNNEVVMSDFSDVTKYTESWGECTLC